MGPPITAEGYRYLVPSEEGRVSGPRIKVVTRVIVLTFALAGVGTFFVGLIKITVKKGVLSMQDRKIYYLHMNKTVTACFLFGDGIGDQVMSR